MTIKNQIELKEIGIVPAKRAGDFGFGDIIALDFGYTLRVIEVKPSIDGTMVRMFVQHVPEENEFYDGESFHYVEYASSILLGIAERHGNEGLC